jgi:hypothetical protein
VTALYPGDRVCVVAPWSSFNGMRGCLVEMRGPRPLVQLDGDVGAVLLFAHEVVGVDEAKGINDVNS